MKNAQVNTEYLNTFIEILESNWRNLSNEVCFAKEKQIIKTIKRIKICII